jgi:FXSXX-COOH protein
LVDLTTISLADLMIAEGTALARAQRRRLREIVDNVTVVTAGFESALPEPDDSDRW